MWWIDFEQKNESWVKRIHGLTASRSVRQVDRKAGGTKGDSDFWRSRRTSGWLNRTDNPLDLLINTPANCPRQELFDCEKFVVSYWNCSVVNSFSSKKKDMPGKLCWSRLPLKQWRTFFFVLTYSHLNTEEVGRIWESYANLTRSITFKKFPSPHPPPPLFKERK